MASDVGQPAPDFTLVDSTGENVTLSQYRDNKTWSCPSTSSISQAVERYR